MNVFPTTYVLLGMTSLVIQTAESEESPRAVVSVWPPGTSIYLRESVSLRCSVAGATQRGWTYRWFKHTPYQPLAPNARHLVSGDSYSITAVAKDDGDRYWCQAERNGTTSPALLSDPAHLTVSELSPPSLAVSPSSRQHFRGERFSVQCPVSERNSTRDWTLRQLSLDFGVRTGCQPLEGAVSEETPGTCIFSRVYSGNSGLYWCESGEQRSNAVYITVSYGSMVIASPAHPVREGEQVTLHCKYWFREPNQTTFYKDREEVLTQNATEMTIDSVTSVDEGFYKCTDLQGKMESPVSWLSVSNNSTSTDGEMSTGGMSDSTQNYKKGTWKWVALACCIVLLLLLITLIGWLVHRYRSHMWWTHSCCISSREGSPQVDLPQTKQDATEVQWDLAWMEMTNLLDKQQNLAGT